MSNLSDLVVEALEKDGPVFMDEEKAKAWQKEMNQKLQPEIDKLRRQRKLTADYLSIIVG